MSGSRPFTIVASASAAVRLDAATAFLRSFSPSQPVTVVAASRGAADDIARRVAAERGATIGIARFSLPQLAARIAAAQLAGHGIAPATMLGTEAVAARVAFDAVSSASLTYFDQVALTPGFPRALASTMADARAAGVAPSELSVAGAAGEDLARLLAAAERELAAAETADRSRLFEAAAGAVAMVDQLRCPLLLVDVPIDGAADARFAGALLAHSTAACATVPAQDSRSLAVLQDAGGTVDHLAPDEHSVLGRLRTYLFADQAPPPGATDDTLQLFSAPGEGREAVEIARRLLAEARRGVPFDEMAVLLRAPQHYQGLLEHAFARARIPAWFDRGTRRPDPAGRAFLALLACADEGLSARRFAEYLSLGQVPAAGGDGEPWVPGGDELVDRAVAGGVADHTGGAADADAVTVPAPRRWEQLLVEASVIGGGAERWARRLDGLEAELTHRLREAERQEEAPRAEGIARERERLSHLRAFALPLVREMGGWRQPVTWGEWLDRLDALAPRVLRVPHHVLRVLADLRPMGTVGPVTLSEVRSVLAERLRLVESPPPARRYGRVFVSTPQQARGRSFRVVFVPGLAERMFPQKPRQDPLLGDAGREAVSSALPTRADQARHERLLLHLAVGAAGERLYLSYPRLEVAEGRGRVPSFYALDLLRAATGRIPDHEVLAAAAAGAGDRSLAWPAPRHPSDAIDDQEHDLAVLRSLLDVGDPNTVRGHAHYILRLNPALRRSLTDRWARAERRWTQYDGITRVIDPIRPALAENRLSSRRYSLSALQRFAACPYQFLLAAIHRLQPAETPQPLQRLDPLTKGSLVHAIQAAFFGRLRDAGALPITTGSMTAALETLEQAAAAVAAQYEERLVPAIPRVWRDELSAIVRDLRGWVRQVAENDADWVPRHFELAFGLPPDPNRDPASVPDAVTVDGRFVLRGSIDLVEEHAATGALRVTDHKTGKDRHKDTLVIGGGHVLQPVLYSLAVEALTGRPVAESRLSFCTSAGGFKVRTVPLTPSSRQAGLEALEIIDRAIELGALPAAPAEGACIWCDFRSVCGPHEAQRVGRKPQEWLADLAALRERP